MNYATNQIPRGGPLAVRCVAPGTGAARIPKAILLALSGMVAAPLIQAQAPDEEDVVILDDFIVGYREVLALNLGLQRDASNLIEVMTADDIGNLPDKNLADTLNRMSGISIQRSQGEGRYVSIRGMEPGLNNVTVNGQTIGASDVRARGGRPPPLELLSAGMIGGLEVHKTITPDMDGHSIGGTVNLIQHSAFDRAAPQFAFASAAWGTNDTLARTMSPGGTNIYEGTLGWGGRFLEGERLGVFVGGNYSSRDYNLHEVNARGHTDVGSQLGVDEIVPVPLRWEQRGITGNRERWGLSANIEFRPTFQTSLYFRSFFTRLDDDSYATYPEIRRRSITEVIDEFRGRATSTYQLDNRSQLERRETWQFILGGEHMLNDDWTVEAALNISEGREVRDEIAHEFKDMRAGRGRPIMEWDLSEPWFPRAVVPDPDNPTRNLMEDPDEFVHSRLRFEPSTVPERVWSANIDLRRELDLYGHGGFLKFGGKFLDREKNVDNKSIRFVPTPGGPLEAGMGELGLDRTSGDYHGAFVDGRMRAHPAADYRQHLDVFLNTAPQYSGPRATASRRTQGLRFWGFDDIGAPMAGSNEYWTYQDAASISNSFEDNYFVEENIHAAYAMADVRPNSQLTIIGGVRVERTEVDLISNSVIADTEGLSGIGQLPPGADVVIEPIRSEKKFTSWLPNLQARYEVNDNLLLRGALTYTIGRPDYIDMSPLNELELENNIGPNQWELGDLEIGNPDLEPFESTNVDFSASYFIPDGAISVGFFYKRIKNPIYPFSEIRSNTEFQGQFIESLSVDSVRNADPGNIRGIELSYQQHFSFLPEPFDGFGVLINFTYISSSVSVPERPGESFDFFRQPSKIGNAQIYYSKGGFEARLAYTWQDDQLDTLGGSVLGDVYEDKSAFLDFRASFRATENWSIFAEVANILREEQRFYVVRPGVAERGPGFLPIGRTFMIGINWRM